MTDPTVKENRTPMKNRKVFISVISAITALVLGVAGWLIFTNVQTANELDAAKVAYRNSLVERSGAVEAAGKSLKLVTDTLSQHVKVAETLTTQLGDGTDVLKAAIAAVAPAKTALDATAPVAPKILSNTAPKNSTAADYSKLTAAIKKSTATYKTYTKAVVKYAAARDAADSKLLAAWKAQVATAPATAEATIAANPNSSQEAKDAVTAAAKAVVEMKDSLGSTAPELWKALQDTSASLVAAEQAYQAQKAAADAEAARQAAAKQNTSKGGSSRAPSKGSSGGSSSGGSSGGGAANTGALQSQLESQIAASLGISASSVHCAPGGIGIRCTWPGGSREFGI